VTYVHEVHAQFAKEAMACQSMDNDEILNVRWATEDPNPVQKVAEKRRLEELGQEAIRSRMDPTVVEAMRAVRALEDGETLETTSDGDDVAADGEEQDAGRGMKRQRLEIENAPSQNFEQEPPKPTGLLSADTLEGLRYFAEIQKRHGVVPVGRKPPQSRTAAANLGLADYGSDDD
jgi:hypothetical protein